MLSHGIVENLFPDICHLILLVVHKIHFQVAAHVTDDPDTNSQNSLFAHSVSTIVG